jgi:two-component system chemotaxis response regulator CheB
MKARQARIIAQDEASSVVYGMPRAAFASGCVDRVLALDDVAAAIVEMLP